MGKKLGVSFSWKRALGVSSAKQKIARMTGIPTTKQGRQRKAGRMLTGGGCLLPLLFVFIILFSSCAPKTNDDQELNQELIRTQIAQTVIAQFAPTETPIPEPTATEPVVSQVSLDYVVMIAGKTDICTNTLTAFSNRMTELSENTYFLFDTGYMDTTYTMLDTFESDCTYFYQDTVPAEFAEINDLFKSVDENYVLAAINLRSGLATIDADKITRAGEYLSTATGYVLQITDMIEEITPAN